MNVLKSHVMAVLTARNPDASKLMHIMELPDVTLAAELLDIPADQLAMDLYRHVQREAKKPQPASLSATSMAEPFLDNEA